MCQRVPWKVSTRVNENNDNLFLRLLSQRICVPHAPEIKKKKKRQFKVFTVSSKFPQNWGQVHSGQKDPF